MGVGERKELKGIQRHGSSMESSVNDVGQGECMMSEDSRDDGGAMISVVKQRSNGMRYVADGSTAEWMKNWARMTTTVII